MTQQGPVTAAIDLTGIWRFQPDPFEEGEHLGYPAFGPQVAAWREVCLPAVVDRLAPVMAGYEGLAWYHRAVDVPADWAGRRVVLSGQGANNRTRIWVNGKPAGENLDPFLPFSARIDPLLVPGRTNTVVLAVDNIRRDADVPGKQRGWRPYGGILRTLVLNATDLCHLDRVHLLPTPQGGGGRVECRIGVSNLRRAAVNASLALQLVDSKQAVVAETVTPASSIGAGAASEITASLQAPSVALWSPDQPALYTVRVVLRAGGKAIDQSSVRIGFRTIQAAGEKLLLNGREIFLLGFNRHEDSPRTDQASDIEIARRDLLDMKRMGCNFVRLCHYPHDPAELDLCDELGLLAMGEIPLYWWGGNYGRDRNLNERGKLDVARRQLACMIERDRHHPSVIIWSASNETFEEHAEVVAGNEDLVRLAKELDPSRLATHVSDKWTSQRHFRPDDLCCINAYPSWAGRGMRQEHDYDLDRSRQWWIDQIAALRAACPGKPILVSEFGNPAFEDVLGNFIGEDAQEQVIRSEFAAMTPDRVCGAVIWCYADHPWPEEDFVRHATTSPFGVVSRGRKPKRAAAAVEELFWQRRGGRPPVARPASSAQARADQDLPVRMVRAHLGDLPQAPPPPAGWSIRAMRMDEGPLWTDIQRDAERIMKIDGELFAREFGFDPQGVARRCFLIVNEHGAAAGTASAWYSRDESGETGRVHWVAVRESQQRRGLARALLAHVMNRLADWHQSAWLATSTQRLGAIRLYLDFGFEPVVDGPNARRAWQQVAARLDHPLIRRALGS